MDKEVDSAKKSLKDMEDSLTNVKKREKELEEQIVKGRTATERFQGIISKKKMIEQLVDKIDKDKQELREQIIKLIGIVKAVSLSMNPQENKEHIQKLQDTFSNVHKKREGIEQELKDLSKMIKGMM